VNLRLDKSAWKRVALGEVVRHVTDRVDVEASGLERFLAGEHIPSGSLAITDWGVIGRDLIGPMFYKRFQPGHILYVSRRTYLRKVAVPDFEGITGEKTFVLESIDRDVLLQEFLPFVLSAEVFHDYAIRNSRGSVNPYLNWGELTAYEFDLPSLSEQKRLSDLLWALEHHRLATVGVACAARRTLQLQIASQLRAFTSARRLGDVTSTRSGPSFAASDVSPVAIEDAITVLGISNTKPDGSIDLTDVGYVKGLPASTATVDEASLILIRTNGNRQRIGNVYLPPLEAHGYAVSAFQFLMKVADPADREYVYWVLSTDDMQGRMSGAASGTTGLGNLAVKWLREQEIPWPESPATREGFLRAVRAFVSAETALRAESATLASLRSSLLADIFGGN
jgi:type I restriction enzyme S subunit